MRIIALQKFVRELEQSLLSEDFKDRLMCVKNCLSIDTPMSMLNIPRRFPAVFPMVVPQYNFFVGFCSFFGTFFLH